MRDRLLRYFLSWLYWFPIIRHNIACRKSLLKPLYKKRCEDGLSCNEGDRKIIYMVLPETTFSGGLSDRLRAIVAIYKQCNTKNLPFRIVFEPLHLQDYLVPNKYDWRISSKDICFDTNKVYPCTLLTYHASTRNRYQQFVQNTILSYYLKRPYQQIHVYSNMICKDEEYGALFNELFKPSAELQELIDYHLNKIGGSNTYVSLTFRFRQLLGDFKEGGETLPEAQREPYIARCLKCIEKSRQISRKKDSRYTRLLHIPHKGSGRRKDIGIYLSNSRQSGTYRIHIRRKQANLHEVICRLLYAC